MSCVVFTMLSGFAEVLSIPCSIDDLADSGQALGVFPQIPFLQLPERHAEECASASLRLR